MNDRELLEYAAKAAGIGPLRCRLDDPMCKDFLIVPMEGGHTKGWNPLTDDGDALRLAAHLRLRIDCGLLTCEVHYNWDEVESFGLVEIITERTAGKVMEGTRRAIVRAAAEIGKAMK